MNEHRFSVVIPLYNKAGFIKRAIDSVLMQTLDDYEIIVVDDGSTDKGPAIVNRYDDLRIRLVSQKNSGVSAARNSGIKAAAGKYISFLDADDLWKPCYLEIVSTMIEQFPDAGAYATAYEEVMPDGKVVFPRYRAIPSRHWQGLLPNYFKSALGPPPVFSSATTVPKKIFQRIGGFIPGVPIGEDLDMWGRIALTYPIAFSSIIGASYFREDDHHIKRAQYYIMNPIPAFVNSTMTSLKRGAILSAEYDELFEYLAKLQIGAGCECLLDGRNPAIARNILNAASPRSIPLKLKKYRSILLTYLPDRFLRLGIRMKSFLFGWCL
jgi:glycosyltransferase involved in cell wall biosynthesis